MSLKKLFFYCLATALAFAATPAFPQSLSDTQRRSLRYHLENLYNEFDLLIRNKKVDQADLAKQQRTISALKIYERIPFSPRLSDLKKELLNSAKEAKLSVSRIVILPTPPESHPPMPKTHRVGDHFFRPQPNQFVQELPFQLFVQGSKEQVDAWTRSWKEDLLRLVEREELKELEPHRSLDRSVQVHYVIRAHAFQFKKVEFPKIIPPRARDYLPAWANSHPDDFSRTEPTLWSFVTRSEQLRPLTPPLYETRGRFFMEGARIDFFLAKAGP